MRNLLFVGLGVLFFNPVYSQTLNDLNFLTLSSLNGSARYKSMAGAFGALGGDLSSITNNPAGSSVFLYNEIGASINYSSRNVKGIYSDQPRTLQGEDFYFDQFGAVFVFNNTNEKSPWKKISGSISVNRVTTFDQRSSIVGPGKKSISDYFLHYADGVALEDIQIYGDESISDIYSYLGEEIGFGAQQAFLGYQSYIIDPLTNNSSEITYVSNIKSDNFNHLLNQLNEGYHRKTSFNFSGLYKDFLHLGFNVNQHRIEFSNLQDFYEKEHDLNSVVSNVNFENSLLSFGQGLSIQFGGILILENFRLGLTYDSPQWINITDETKQKISSFRFDEGLSIKEIVDPNVINSFDIYELKVPSKSSISFAYILNKKGLLSVEYNNQNLSNIKLGSESISPYLNELTSDFQQAFTSINTIKFGGEYRIEDLSLRAGYYQRSNNKKNIFKNDNSFTFGIGFDFGSSNFSLSFVQSTQNQNLQLFSAGLTDEYDLENKLTELTLSYNIKF